MTAASINEMNQTLRNMNSTLNEALVVIKGRKKVSMIKQPEPKDEEPTENKVDIKPSNDEGLQEARHN